MQSQEFIFKNVFCKTSGLDVNAYYTSAKKKTPYFMTKCENDQKCKFDLGNCPNKEAKPDIIFMNEDKWIELP